MKKLLSILVVTLVMLPGVALGAGRRYKKVQQNCVANQTYATAPTQCCEKKCKGRLPRTRRYSCPRQEEPGCCFSSYGSPSRYGIGNAWNPYPGWGYFRKDTYGTNFNF